MKNDENYIIDDCAYCGGEDFDCPYHHSGTYLANDVNKKSKLIVDPSLVHKAINEIEKKTAASKCPVCSSGSFVIHNKVLICNECKTKWIPARGNLSIIDKLNDDAFWSITCPKCNFSSGLVKVSDNLFECLFCDQKFDFKELNKHSQVKPKVMKETDTEIKISKTETTKLLVCKKCGGYLANGLCLRCGKEVLAKCPVCKKPYEDSSQVSGQCRKCASKKLMGSGIQDIKCPRCKHVTNIAFADLYSKCTNCEDIHPIKLKIQKHQKQKKVSKHSKKELACLDRWLENKRVINDRLDEMFYTLDKLKSFVLEYGSEVPEEFTELESLVQGLVDVQDFIETGSGFHSNDDTIDDEDIDEDVFPSVEEENRWADFELSQAWREARNRHESNYSNVEITDAGNDFSLTDGSITLDNLQKQSLCPICETVLDKNGNCSYCLLDRACMI